MIQSEGMVLSPYIALYDIIIPKDHELRQLNELVDFSFVDEMLRDTYTLDNGRPGWTYNRSPCPETYSAARADAWRSSCPR